jgi:hypothetical protein
MGAKRSQLHRAEFRAAEPTGNHEVVWPDGRRVPAHYGRHPHELQPSEGVTEQMAAENRSSHAVKVASGAPNKIERALHEYKHGELHSGSKSGPKVTNRKQAIAIALSEQRKANRGGYS